MDTLIISKYLTSFNLIGLILYKTPNNKKIINVKKKLKFIKIIEKNNEIKIKKKIYKIDNSYIQFFLNRGSFFLTGGNNHYFYLNIH